MDNANGAWFADNGNNVLLRITSAGATTTCSAGGLSTPGFVAIDGAGDVFTNNDGPSTGGTTSPGTISAFTNNCTAISRLTGFDNGSPRGGGNSGIRSSLITIDGSGNVWTVNAGSDAQSKPIGNVTQFIGLAVPVATPIVPGQLGTRP